MKNLSHTEALQIVVEAARAYAEITADRESQAYKKKGTPPKSGMQLKRCKPRLCFNPPFKAG